MSRKIFFFVRISLLLLFFLFFGSCYLLQQGSYIISYNSKAKKIENLLKDENLDPTLRDTFLLVQKIKKFAIEELGLKNDKNYTTFIPINKDYLVDVVSACKKEGFIPYTWWYPFFGSFPYKGFFKREDALKEMENLRKKNLDVLMREVDAFSTLGFFTDPLYSYMTEYSVFSMASLIIHEQTHATIWVNNHIQFNEELATFVGREGALLFIKKTFGENSKEYAQSLASMEDNKRFISLMKLLYKDLKALYSLDIDSNTKLKVKSLMIMEFRNRFRSIYYRDFHNKNYKNFASFSFNNAYIMLYITYTEDLSIFYDLYKQQEFDLKTTIAQIKQVKSQKGDPKEYLKKTLPDR
ncbi:MAG: aminopeptidase [Spirochaetales bacterium]|nr:aminopeptidase [Spirochaetales bacterium]